MNELREEEVQQADLAAAVRALTASIGDERIGPRAILHLITVAEDRRVNTRVLTTSENSALAALQGQWTEMEWDLSRYRHMRSAIIEGRLSDEDIYTCITEYRRRPRMRDVS